MTATLPLSSPAMQRRVAVSSVIGTTIEWYDFFIYGSAAALVFAPQFFPDIDPVAGLLSSFATFAIGFLARPIGGIVMGHYGDRVGRKSMLVLSMLMMGIGSMLIGLLPSYATIGVAAPILLVVLRMVQGFGVGGEWGGAVLMTVEHAPQRRRTFFGSLVQVGTPLGIILSNLVFIVVGNAMGSEAFATWGWRIPFLLSAALVAVGLIVRLRITESPSFAQLRDERAVRRTPLVELLHSYWRPLLQGSFASVAVSAVGYIVLVYMLSYGVTALGIAQSTMLWLILGGAVVWAFAIVIAAQLADRVGQRIMFLAGAILTIVFAFPFFLLVDTAQPALILLAFAVAVIAVGCMAGPQAALIAGMFPAEVRYSGASVAYQIGAVLGGGIAPLIATALYAATKTSTLVAIYVIVLALISLVAMLTLRQRSTTLSEHDTADAAEPAGGADA